MQNWEKNKGVTFLEKVGIRKDFHLLDFGARRGTYSIPAAKIVGKNGEVFSLDKNKSALITLQNRSKNLGLENIKIVNTDGDLQLDFQNNLFDAVLFYDILHMLTRNQRRLIFTEAFRVLKPKALLSVYPKHIKTDCPNAEFKNLSLEDVISEIEEHNFIFSEKICDNLMHDDFPNFGCVINFIPLTLQ